MGNPTAAVITLSPWLILFLILELVNDDIATKLADEPLLTSLICLSPINSDISLENNSEYSPSVNQKSKLAEINDLTSEESKPSR